MLLAMTEWLASAHSGFNVFRYLTLRAILGARLTALALALMVGPLLIRRPRRVADRSAGARRRPTVASRQDRHPDDGRCAHPHRRLGQHPPVGRPLANRFVWVVLLVMLAFGAIGWADDWRKLAGGDAKGLPARQKYFWQSAVGLGCAVFLYHTAQLPVETQLIVPFFKNVVLDLGWGYVVLTYFVIVGSSNAVNLTDGLDGLAILPTVMVVGGARHAFAYVDRPCQVFRISRAARMSPGVGEIVVLSAPLSSELRTRVSLVQHLSCPGLHGRYRRPRRWAPSSGSIAVVVRQELVLLFIMGGVFVMETVSVILQVASYKLTGKRIFRMAPLHHHFELKGWPEPRVIVRFWVITVVLVLIGLTTLKIR